MSCIFTFILISFLLQFLSFLCIELNDIASTFFFGTDPMQQSSGSIACEGPLLGRYIILQDSRAYIDLKQPPELVLVYYEGNHYGFQSFIIGHPYVMSLRKELPTLLQKPQKLIKQAPQNFSLALQYSARVLFANIQHKIQYVRGMLDIYFVCLGYLITRKGNRNFLKILVYIPVS